LKRKDCGKIEEIGDFSSIDPYKTGMMLEEEEDIPLDNVYIHFRFRKTDHWSCYNELYRNCIFKESPKAASKMF
jgi:hypothetical protein